jgi:DUF1365 family protein
MSDALQPAVCFGAVMHERHVQAHNRFVYPSAFLRLPLGRLDTSARCRCSASSAPT